MADGQRAKNEIEQEETARFFWAVKVLEKTGRGENIQVLGHREHHAELLPIPSKDFINAGFDPIGKTGGCLNPAEFTVDYDRRVWMGLQFKRDEIEAMRSVCRFVDPDAPPPVTIAQRNEDWADRAQIMHDRGATWDEAADAIGKSDGATGDYVARIVRMVRNMRKRENGKTI